MKKHLLAASVAMAFAAPAMAQNVTMYGTIDAGVAQLSNVTTGKTDATVYTDGSVASSVWGMRGSEDLGGGLRAVFQLESDIQTNNGGLNQNGLWRRGAYAGVAGPMGELTFGLRTNPIIATNGALMPVAGNSVSTLTSVAMSFADFYTKNAVTYTTPNLSGLVAQLQYGFGQSITAGSQGGAVTAGSAVYTAGPVTFRAAFQDRKDNGVASSANSSIPGAAGIAGSMLAVTNDATAAAFEAKAYVAGVSFVAGNLTIAGAALSNKEATAIDGAKTSRSATQFGVGYRLSPAVLLGATTTKGEGSQLTNLQARYSLSKRTTAYAMYGMSDNGNNGRMNFLPYAGNTGTLPSQLVQGYTSGATGIKSTAVGAGLMHSF